MGPPGPACESEMARAGEEVGHRQSGVSTCLVSQPTRPDFTVWLPPGLFLHPSACVHFPLCAHSPVQPHRFFCSWYPLSSEFRWFITAAYLEGVGYPSTFSLNRKEAAREGLARA